MHAILPAAAQVFWSPTPLQGNEIFLGQNGQENRLLEVPVDYILERRQLARFLQPGGTIGSTQTVSGRERFSGRFQNLPVWDWPADIFQALVAVANNPTPEEIEDLALIDAFFYGPYPERLATRRQQQSAPAGILMCKGRGYRGLPAGVTDLLPRYIDRDIQPDYKALPQNPFFCPPPYPMPQPQTFWVWKDQKARYFGISNKALWGDVRHAVQASVTFLEALVDYPFPRPISVMPGIWYWKLKGDIQNYVAMDMIHTVPLDRMWITIATTMNYDEISAKIIKELKEKAKRKKRKAIIKKIAFGLTLGVISLGVGQALAGIIPAGIPVGATEIASATTQAIEMGVDYRDRKQMAEAMEKVAKQFERDDPRFAEEARKTAETFEFLSAEAERAAELAQDEAEAIAEGETEREIGPETHGQNLDFFPEDSPLTALLIGGGIAAGVVGLLTVLK